MNEEKLSCKVIEDLIPLYCEGLCSEETRTLVDAHIRDCDACRKLCEATPQEPQPEPEQIPDEAKVFKKVNRKMKKHRLLSYGLLILVALLILLLARMSMAQAARLPGERFPTFETVFETIRIRSIIHSMKHGNTDKLTDSFFYTLHNFTGNPYKEEAYRNAAKLIHDTYQAEYGDAKMKKIKYSSVYLEGSYLKSRASITAEIEYSNNQLLMLTFVNGKEDGYTLVTNSAYLDSENIPESEPDNTNLFCDAIHYINTAYEYEPFDLALRYMYDNASEPNIAFWNYFSKERRGSVKHNFNMFIYRYEYRLIDSVLSAPRYDPEADAICYDLELKAGDASGTAVLTTTFIRDSNGLIPQDVSKNRVETDNCTPELADALLHLFAS